MADEELLKVQVHVSARAAITAGKTATGKRELSIRADELRALPDELRLELALAYEASETIGLAEGDPPMAEPTLEALRVVLDARAKVRKEHAEAERKASARRDEEAKASARAIAAKDNARSKALRAWIEKNGDDEQKARMKEGFLREDEILDAVAEELIDVRGYETYEPMHKGEVCECACAGAVVFVKDAPRYMDGFQFAKLTAIREQLPEGATAEPVEHRGKCPKCTCLETARITARVTLPWEGWLLVREFSLK